MYEDRHGNETTGPPDGTVSAAYSALHVQYQVAMTADSSRVQLVASNILRRIDASLSSDEASDLSELLVLAAVYARGGAKLLARSAYYVDSRVVQPGTVPNGEVTAAASVPPATYSVIMDDGATTVALVVTQANTTVGASLVPGDAASLAELLSRVALYATGGLPPRVADQEILDALRAETETRAGENPGPGTRDRP